MNPAAGLVKGARLACLSIAGRLTLWFAASSFLLLLTAAGLVYWTLAPRLATESRQHLQTKARLVDALLSEPRPPGEAVAEIRKETMSPAGSASLVRVLGDSGRVVAETPGMGDELPVGLFPGSGGPTLVRGRSGASYWVVSTRADAAPPRRRVQVASLADDGVAMLAPYQGRLWLGLAGAFLLCGLGGYRIARHGIRPVRRLIETAHQIGGSTLGTRIDTPHLPAELMPLGATFNAMLDRLQCSFERVSGCSDDIAHELRTPLSIIRGQIEVALAIERSPDEYREVLESSLEEVVALSDLVHRLLFLSRLENDVVAAQLESVDIHDQLAKVREFYEPAATEAGVALEVAAAAPVVLPVDRILFQRAIGNLVINAVRHTPPGGAVRLAAAPSPEGAAVSVADTGCGIAAEHLPCVFHRFHRGSPGRPAGDHLGLGLAIVKAIVGLHQGSIAVTSAVGAGTCVTITLPAHPPEGGPPRP